jgi:hypothetical protein
VFAAVLGILCAILVARLFLPQAQIGKSRHAGEA